MRYFDAFTGIGGFTLAIYNAYESLCHADGSQVGGSEKNQERNETQGLFSTQGEDICTETGQSRECASNSTYERPLCIGYSEIDKYASSIYASHYPTHNNYGDITKIDADTLPDFDLLVGGFPCQSFSIAGKRGGFNDTRGTMFFELARILRAKQPRLFVFENVKGLLSHDSGNTFKVIIATITELGYDCQWQVLNSKNFGVPQNRERVFIVGHRRGTPRPEVFPIRASSQISTEQDAQRYAHCLQAGSDKHRGTYIESDLLQGILDKRIAIRKLTPLECERLQGFPDRWTEGVSDTQRYKCLGNAVTVNVVQYIIYKLTQ